MILKEEKKRKRKRKKENQKYPVERLKTIWDTALDQKTINNYITQEEYKKVDGFYLRGLVPIAKKKLLGNISEDAQEKVEKDCIKHLIQRANDGYYDGEYIIQRITPGVPSYDIHEMQYLIAERLNQRANLVIKKDKKNPTKLYINWDPNYSEIPNPSIELKTLKKDLDQNLLYLKVLESQKNLKNSDIIKDLKFNHIEKLKNKIKLIEEQEKKIASSPF